MFKPSYVNPERRDLLKANSAYKRPCVSGERVRAR